MWWDRWKFYNPEAAKKMEEMGMACKKHGKYKAIRRPRVDCLECWKSYAMELEEKVDHLLANLAYVKQEEVEMCGTCAERKREGIEQYL